MKDIKPEASKGPSDNFTGDVYVTIVMSGEGESRVRVASVHFTPGAHTAWHSHGVGQYLHVTEGTALVQEKDGRVKVMKPGETVYTAPGIEHWHGAAPDSFMIHLAIWEAKGGDGPDINWLDHITGEEYDNAAKQISNN